MYCQGLTRSKQLTGMWVPAILLPADPGCSAVQASAAQCKAEACPKTALLRQLLSAVAAGEAALEEVAPTRYNLVRLVLVSSNTAVGFPD